MSHTSNINNLYPKPTTTLLGAVVAGQSLAPTNAANFAFAAFNTNTNVVFFDVQTSDVIVTFDGSTPVLGTNGHRLAVGTNYTWSPAAALAAKFRSATATTAFIWLQEFSI